MDDQGRRLEGRCRPPLRQHRAAVGPRGHGRVPPAKPLRDPHGRHRRVRDRDRRRRARRVGRRASPDDPERPLRSLESDGRRDLPIDDRHRWRAPAARPPDEPRVRPCVPARPSRRGGQVPRAQGQGRPLRREGGVASRILRETRLPAAHAARAKPLRGGHHRQRDPVLRHRRPVSWRRPSRGPPPEERRGSRSSSRFQEGSFCRARRETGRPWRSTPTPSTVRNASRTSWPSLWASTSRARARGSPREAFAISASCDCRPATIACALSCATRTRAGPV